MAVTSFPWTSVTGDRTVSNAMDSAFFAAGFANGILTGYTVTASGGNVSVAAGTAIVQGRVVTNDATVTLTPTTNRRARVVLRLDISNRTAEVALSGTSTSYPALTQSGTVWELGLGTVDTTGATVITDTREDTSLCGVYNAPGTKVAYKSANTGVVWVASWTGTGQSVKRNGDIVGFHLLGSWPFDHPVGADSVSTINVATLPEGFRPTNVSRQVSGLWAGRAALFEIDTNGLVAVKSVAGSGNVPAGATLFVSGTFLK